MAQVNVTKCDVCGVMVLPPQRSYTLSSFTVGVVGTAEPEVLTDKVEACSLACLIGFFKRAAERATGVTDVTGR